MRVDDKLVEAINRVELVFHKLDSRKYLPEVEAYLALLGMSKPAMYSEDDGHFQKLVEDPNDPTPAPDAKSVLDRSPRKNWVEKRGGLPQYIRRIAIHLVEKGMSIAHAIATAINVVKKMCSTGDLNWPGLQHAKPPHIGEACADFAHWQALKGGVG